MNAAEFALHKRPFWMHGDMLPIISGGDGSTEGGEGGAGDGGEGGTKTFTQADVDRIVAREKGSASDSAKKHLADQLGVSVEEAAQIIKDRKESNDAKLTEAEKREKDATAAVQKAEERESAASAREHAANVRMALIEAGVPADKLKHVARALEVDEGADEDAITAAIKDLQTAVPEFFTASGDDGTNGGKPKPKPKAPSSDPQATAPKSKQKDDAFSAGAERAKAYGQVNSQFQPMNEPKR